MAISLPLPIVKETKNETYLEFEFEKPSLTEIEEAVESIQNHPNYHSNGKFHLIFATPIYLYGNKKKEQQVTFMDARFFKSVNGLFCYTLRKNGRSGYPLELIKYDQITSLSYRLPKDPEKEREEAIQKILKRRYDDQTWSDLDPENLRYQSLTIRNIKKLLPSHELERLKKAFDTKSAYSYRFGRDSKRHFSIETKMCEDGVFRAWFSSEYAGCLNGQYYLLLNPTTACFCEHD